MTAGRTRPKLSLGVLDRVEPMVNVIAPPPDVRAIARVESAAPEARAADWVRNNRARIDQLLDAHGALLLRGFAERGADGFEAVIDALAAEPMGYVENTSPRKVVRGHIRTSTEYPAAHPIVLHNEHSYSAVVPRRLMLFCQTPASTGGETPLADCRRVLRRLDPALVDRFRRRAWSYVRDFGSGLGPSWQTVFATELPAEVDRHCSAADIETTWRDGVLRTRQVRTPTVFHPRTGEEVWFNHICFWHVSSLEPAVKDAITAATGAAEPPNNTYFGDGEAIDEEVIAALRAAYDAERISFPWERGDVLLVDNLLMAHGRESFTGLRQTYFVMLDPVARRTLERRETT